MPQNPTLPASVPAFLATFQGEKYVDGWAALWDKGGDMPWDFGQPNPAFEDTLAQKQSIIEGPLKEVQGKVQRKKALVPGCGRGLDVLLLASFGYDAYGLEYSAAAVEACREEETSNGSLYPIQDPKVGRGEVVFVQGDFFKDGWLESLQFSWNCFDLVYDYKFFCALNPSMRPSWALRVTQLLSSSPPGNLICLESPRDKDPLILGPPWGISSEVYMEHLSHPGDEIPYDDRGQCRSDPLWEPSEQGLKQVAYWQPVRTHCVGINATGEVHDRVSVWRRR